MGARLKNFFHREIGGLHEAAYIVALASLGSQVLALVRDRLLAHTFGAGADLDIYYAAFRVPDLIYATIASFVSVNVLIPFLVQWVGPGSSEDSRRAEAFLSGILTVFVSLLGVVLVAAYFLAPNLGGAVAPGFSPEAQEKLVVLMRILLLSPLFLGLSNILGGVTQSLKRFYVYALSPLVYNIAIIFGILFLYPVFGLPGLGLGVILGAFFHMLVQMPLVWSMGIFPGFTFKIYWREIREVLFLSAPRTLALALTQISFVVLGVFASYMSPGSTAIFTFAYSLQSVPLALIGISYSVAAFPTLSRLWKEDRRDEFARHVSVALRHIVFLALPVTALFLVLRVQIVEVILGSGRFTHTDALITGGALGIYVLSLFAQSFVLLFTRSYYAAGNTSRPLSMNFVSSVATILLAPVFVWLFETNLAFASGVERFFGVSGISGTVVLMLPLAATLGTLLNALVLGLVFRRDFPLPSRLLFKTFLESLLGALVLGVVAYLSLGILVRSFDGTTFLGLFMPAFLAGSFGAISAALLLYALGNHELKELYLEARRRLPWWGA